MGYILQAVMIDLKNAGINFDLGEKSEAINDFFQIITVAKSDVGKVEKLLAKYNWLCNLVFILELNKLSAVLVLKTSRMQVFISGQFGQPYSLSDPILYKFIATFEESEQK